MQTSGGGGVPEPPEAKPQVEAAISEGVGEFVHDVVERALGQLKDDAERDLVRDSLETALTRTLREIADEEVARRQAPLTGGFGAGDGGPLKLGESAMHGMEVARQVQSLGFVEFTTGLVNGVFDALIASTLKQMNGYAKLVNDIGSSLAQFAADNVSGAEVDAHLSTKYPDGDGGTVVRPTYVFQDTLADDDAGTPAKTGNEKLKEVAQSLSMATDDLPESRRLWDADLDVGTATSFTATQVRAVRKAIGFLLAFDMRNMLRDMVREGMARIVVRDGKILTKLTFNVGTTERAQKQLDRYQKASADTYIHGEANYLWAKFRAGTDLHFVNVNTVNEKSFDELTMATEMIGQVEINFRTETFPPREIALPAET